jgi:beta-RFAP synthase
MQSVIYSLVIGHWSLVIGTSLVTVIAPSRLHFGLYGFGEHAARQFGGVGVMIESPFIKLTATAAERFSASGPLASRVEEFARRWAAFHAAAGMHSTAELPDAAIEVLAVPPEHSGLGVGTQLGLSVAAALNALYKLPSVTPAELAQSVGRGLRSAVGTYGFFQGGLIAERGKLPGEPISPLDARIDLPEAWRFVLVVPAASASLAGQAEVQAFEQLPPVSPASSDELVRLARDELFPAAAAADFARFTAALGRYCYLAGLCFAAVQGGAYNGPVLTRLVEEMRSCGGPGVGQSSWGPTLFALIPDAQAAERFVRELKARCQDIAFQTLITSANNRGVSICQ